MISSFSRSVSLIALSLLLSPLSNSIVTARWTIKDEANIECLNSTTHFKVNQDGTWTMELEEQFKILTEAGRQVLSTQTYTYDATLDTFDVLEAKICSNGIETIVPKEKMEDKPLASDPKGLSQNHQILIPFERVTVGSIIHLKTKRCHFKPQYENYFSGSQTFNNGNLWTHNRLTIDSELPLFLKINDPRKILDVKCSEEGSNHRLEVNLKEKVCEQLVSEPDNSYQTPEMTTSVSFSTEKDHKRIGQIEATFYQSALTEPLPEELENIRSIASNVKDETDCIDTVVTSLIKKITYLGSWNIAEGHLVPRSLKAITLSGYGDCKEYSVCLAAILNKLGYQAKIVTVNRGIVYLEEDEEGMFNNGNFNHAIVKAIAPSGKTYWIDPTNNVSMAGGIFPDIADRPALVLDVENPTYERIPPIDYKNAKFSIEKNITIKDDGSVKTEGTFNYSGEEAIELTETLSLHPLSITKDAIMKGMCKNPINPTLNITENTSRIVRPLEATFSYDEEHVMSRTNYGDAFQIRNSWHKPYIATSQNDEGALYIDHPQTLFRKTIFKNVSAEGLEKLAFSIQTPWVNAERDLAVTEEGVVVTETIEQLKSIIPPKDLKSEEYRKLQSTLRNYCERATIIFSKKGL